jgi:hypothetical protein
MNFKPADFFLGIADFLGMLVPGAVLVFLEADWIHRIFGVSPLQPPWLVFAAAAYLLGHLLLALTEALNWLAKPVARKIWPFSEIHKEAVKFGKISVPFLGKAATDHAGTAFHAALSFLRLKHPDAAAEIDRHMAGYKLLRNLVAVFLIDLIGCLTLSMRGLSHTTPRLVADFVLMLLFFLAFVRMLQWAQLLAFQYCILIQEQKLQSQASPPLTTNN